MAGFHLGAELNILAAYCCPLVLPTVVKAVQDNVFRYDPMKPRAHWRRLILVEANADYIHDPASSEIIHLSDCARHRSRVSAPS